MGAPGRDIWCGPAPDLRRTWGLSLPLEVLAASYSSSPMTVSGRRRVHWWSVGAGRVAGAGAGGGVEAVQCLQWITIALGKVQERAWAGG